MRVRRRAYSSRFARHIAGNPITLLCRTDSPAERPEFEVFDVSGRSLGCARRAKVGPQVLVIGNLLYTVVLDKFDVAGVVRYRINR